MKIKDLKKILEPYDDNCDVVVSVSFETGVVSLDTEARKMHFHTEEVEMGLD